jgi:hypothetical protein
MTKKLRAGICIDTTQKQSEKGLRFSIRIANDSATDMTVRNPMDMFIPGLLNDSGHTVTLPYVPRNTIKSNAAKHIVQAFNITGIKANGRIVQDDLAEKDEVIIPAKGVYEIFLSITKARKPGAKPEETMPVGKGLYHLIILLDISASQEGYHAAVARNIPVHYN